MDGIGGNCPIGYTLGSEADLSAVSNLFMGLNYKTAVSDNCCVITTASVSNYGMNSQCNAQGPFTNTPSLNGAGCRNYAPKSGSQLTLCVSN